MGHHSPLDFVGMRGLVCICFVLLTLASTFSLHLKRAPFNSWAGKRFDPFVTYDDTLEQLRELYGAQHPLSNNFIDSSIGDMDKRGGKPRAFSSWAGKRAPFSSWAGKRSGLSVERPEWYQEDYARKKRSLASDLQ